MKQKVRLFKIELERGYRDEVSQLHQQYMDAHPDMRNSPSSPGYWIEHYKPKAFAGTADQWAEYAKNKENHPELFEKYPHWGSIKMEVQDEEYLALKAGQVRFSDGDHRIIELAVKDVEFHTANLTMMEQLLELNDRVISQLKHVSGTMFNDKVNAMISGPLMHMNQLMLCEDQCTDAMQQHLDDGWCIVAIQPQPDQRRPDYILARHNPNHVSDGRGALRG